VKLCNYVYVYIFLPPRDTPPNSLARAITLVCIKSWLVRLMYCMRIFMISSILLGRCWNNAMNLATNISFPLFKFAEHNLPFIPVTLNNLCSWYKLLNNLWSMDYTLLLYHMITDTLHTLRCSCYLCNLITQATRTFGHIFFLFGIFGKICCLLVSYEFSNELTILVLYNYVQYSYFLQKWCSWHGMCVWLSSTAFIWNVFYCSKYLVMYTSDVHRNTCNWSCRMDISNVLFKWKFK
jgi:hypothetical protein